MSLALLVLSAPAAAKPIVRPEPLIATTAICHSSQDCTLTLRLRERSRGDLGTLGLVVEGLPGGPQALQISRLDKVLTWAGAATAAVALIGLDTRRWRVSMRPPTDQTKPLPTATAADTNGAAQWGSVAGAPLLRRGAHGDWHLDGAPEGCQGLVVDGAGSPIGRFNPAKGFRLLEPLLSDGRVWVYDAQRAWSWPLSPSGQLDATE
jgi:hypothetical protein